MTMLQHALRLGALGFWVFRLQANGKKPLRTGWQNEASMLPHDITKLWTAVPNANIGIFTGRYDAHMALVAVDEDNKDGRNGADTIATLDFEGKEFPPTFTQTTPTGGKHHVYYARRPVNQGNANVLGPGVDLRSRGGYIVGSGSVIDGKYYTDNGHDIVECPKWLFDLRDIPEAPKVDIAAHGDRINADAATARAMRYLEEFAPTAEDGERNGTAYKVAAQVKDFGVFETECIELMSGWNGTLENPLEDEELETTVRSVYKTSANVIGSLAAETVFDNLEKNPVKIQKPEKVKEQDNKEPTPHPWEVFAPYSIVAAGGGHHILQEGEDINGNFKLEHIQENSFHRLNAHHLQRIGNGDEPISQIWWKDKNTRRYAGLVFAPNQNVPARFYNLWRGFAFAPVPYAEASPAAREGLRLFLEHALDNVCNGDNRLFRALIGYFAHIIQHPDIKPLFALVFKGGKGVGKNALVQIIAMLLGNHAMLTSKKRYLTSNFNGHMENLLMLILDEAFWSGDKEAEGGLKDLITGKTHTIERKCQESYEVANLLRLFILGNEKWLVPATHDERRFCVFHVNDNRKQDTKYFIKMRECMEQGGYQLLLSFLQEWDLSDFDPNQAIVTPALIEQKIKTLELPGQWWYDSLRFGELSGSTMTGCDFTAMEEQALRQAFSQYCRGRNARTRLPDNISFYEDLRQFAPSMIREERRGTSALYRAKGLDQLRKDFENHLGGKITWQDTLNDQAQDDVDPMS